MSFAFRNANFNPVGSIYRTGIWGWDENVVNRGRDYVSDICRWSSVSKKSSRCTAGQNRWFVELVYLRSRITCSLAFFKLFNLFHFCEIFFSWKKNYHLRTDQRGFEVLFEGWITRYRGDSDRSGQVLELVSLLETSSVCLGNCRVDDVDVHNYPQLIINFRYMRVNIVCQFELLDWNVYIVCDVEVFYAEMLLDSRWENFRLGVNYSKCLPCSCSCSTSSHCLIAI